MAGIRSLTLLPSKLKKIKNHLKANLPEKRYLHSLSVADWARDLAVHHRLDGEQAYLAGLLHDCARTLHPDDLFKLLRRYRGRYFDEDTKANPSLWHNPGGIMIASKEYGIKHPFILRAIALHSTGDSHMRWLDKVIYVADYSEPNRGFSHAKQIRQAALKDLELGVYLTAHYKVDYLKQAGKVVHPRSLALIRKLEKMKIDRT